MYLKWQFNMTLYIPFQLRLLPHCRTGTLLAFWIFNRWWCLVLLQGRKKECAFQSVHQLFQAPVHTFLSDITQRHHYCCSIHPNNVKSMCQVQAQCWGIFEPTCQHQPHEDCSLVFRDISIIITQYQETRFCLTTGCKWELIARIRCSPLTGLTSLS